MKTWQGRTTQWFAIAIVLSVARAGGAAEPEEDENAASRIDLARVASTATIERIMTQAVRNIAIRYNLNAAQTAKTDALMKREVQAFLSEHEEEIWPAIRDLLGAQLGARPPGDRDEVIRMGKLARPLAKLAKGAIFRANAEWRLGLTTDQKKLHDFDLAEMEKTFQHIDDNFASWEKGEPLAGGIFPRPSTQPADGLPPLPRKPKGNALPPPQERSFDATIFDTFVEHFIREYELDKGQTDSARSILKEYKDQAKNFMIANRVQFGKILTAQEHAIRNRHQEKIATAETLRKKLLAPVYALFAKMEDRLKSLLSTAQLESYNASNRAPRSETADDGKSASGKRSPPERESAKTPASAAGNADAPDPETGKGSG